MLNFFNNFFFKSKSIMNKYLKQEIDIEINLKLNFNYSINHKN